MLSKKDWQDIDKEFESYRSFCRQKQTDKDDCRAEIERLEKEVERLAKTLDANTKANDAAVTELLASETASWNDAIEAAKDAAYEWALKHAHKKVKYSDLRDEILSLKRS